MAHGEGIKQEQGNIAETGELVTKDVGRLRLVYHDGAGHQPPSNHALGHGTEGHKSGIGQSGKGGRSVVLRRVDPGNFAPSRSQIRTRTSRFIRLVPPLKGCRLAARQ